MTLKKCNPKGFHRFQHKENTECIFCGLPVFYSDVVNKHTTHINLNKKTYTKLYDALLSTLQEVTQENEPTVNPSNNPTEWVNYSWTSVYSYDSTFQQAPSDG